MILGLLFLPAAGVLYGGLLRDPGVYGGYLSRNAYSYNGMEVVGLSICAISVTRGDRRDRYYPQSVRLCCLAQ